MNTCSSQHGKSKFWNDSFKCNLRFSQPCLRRLMILRYNTVSEWVVPNISKHCSAFNFEWQTVQKDCLAMCKQWPTLSKWSMTYLKQFSRWWKSFNTHRKIHSDSMQYNWFWKSRFLYAVNKHQNEWSVPNGNKCSWKICVLHWTTPFLS